MSLAFREAREADLDRLVEIHQSAFPDERAASERRRNFAHNPLGGGRGLEHLLVAEQGSRIVAHGFLFPLEAWFGGLRVRVGGIASLGVAPEARGAGAGRALLAAMHARARERGDAITLLYPFRRGFYARDGYAPVSSYRALELCPRAIPRAWADPALGQPRPAGGDDRPALVRIHEQEGLRHSGWLARPDALWEKRLLDERRSWFMLDRGDRAVGYIGWKLAQAEPHARISLIVDELAACDDDARRRLLALAAAQADQVAVIELDVADDDPLPLALVDPDRDREGTLRIEHGLGTLVAGPLVRMLDVRRAILARGFAGEGGVDLELPGETIHLAIQNGQARVLAPQGGGRLRLDAAALGSLLYGAVAPSQGARLGWLTADDPGTLALADALFALPAFFSQDPF